MKTILLLIIPIILFISCENDTSGVRFPEEFYYIVTGKLYEGEPVTLDKAINVSKTIPYESGSIYDTFVDNADVKIVYINNLGERREWPLVFGFEPADTTEDSYSIMKVGYYDPTGSLIPEVDKKYTLEVSILSDDDSDSTFIWAETKVPKDIRFMADEAFSFNTDYIPDLRYETAERDHPIVLELESSTDCNILFSFYCLEGYQDARRIRKFLNQVDYPDSKRDYEDPLTGWPRKIEYYNSFKPVGLAYMPRGYYIVYSGYKASIWFYGNYRIRIFNMDTNLYNYQKAETDPFLYGGVNNAYGYFGSVSGSTIYTNIIE